VTVAVVIPARGEAATIGGVLDGLAALPAATVDRVIVVDDGSLDATAAVAAERGASVVRHERNRGKGAALRSGFAEAVAGGAELVVTMDADGQHDARDLPRLLARVARDRLDLLVGYRQERIAGSPPQNLLVNWLMSLLIATLSGVRLHDSQCGFRVHRVRLLRAMRLRCTSFDLETEVIFEARRAGARVGEAPVRTIYIPGRKSWIRPGVEALRFFALLLKR